MHNYRKRPQIAVLQSLKTDSDNKGPFFSPFLEQRGNGGFEIDPTQATLDRLMKNGELRTKSGKKVDLIDLDGLIWRARVSDGFKISCEIQRILADKYNVHTMEEPANLSIAASKIRTAEKLVGLEEQGIYVPKTKIVHLSEIADANYDEVFDEYALQDKDGIFKVIVKPEFGFSGKNIKLLETPAELNRYAEQASKDKAAFVIQSPVYNQDRTSIRVDVVDGKPIHSMLFHPKGSELSSTSGKVEKLKVSDEILELAVKANKALGGDKGLFFAGVDIMLDHDGKPHVLEVNIPGVWYLDHGEMDLKTSTLSAVTNAFERQIARANSPAQLR